MEATRNIHQGHAAVEDGKVDASWSGIGCSGRRGVRGDVVDAEEVIEEHQSPAAHSAVVRYRRAISFSDSMTKRRDRASAQRSIADQLPLHAASMLDRQSHRVGHHFKLFRMYAWAVVLLEALGTELLCLMVIPSSQAGVAEP